MNNPTIKVEAYREAAKVVRSSESGYRGIAAHALPGLHDYVGKLIGSRVALGSDVLDLGAGAGAMSARLIDMGYAVCAVDIVPENFRAERATFIQADLNGNFAPDIGESFDAVIAVEIIEHLENPRHFLRQCASLLRAGGQLVVTTPNIDNPVSQALFLRSGHYQWFSANDYDKHGHLTPLSQAQLRQMLSESGLLLDWQCTFGDPFAYLSGSPRMRLLARMIERLTGAERSSQGEISVMLARKV